MLRHIEQPTQISRIDAHLSADVFGKHCSADKAVSEAASRVEAKRWMPVAVSVALRIDARAMQPLAVLLEALGVEVLR
jgi:hypothetical protein